MAKRDNVDKLAHHFDDEKSAQGAPKKKGTFKKDFCNFVNNAYLMGVVFADFAAAYILWFQGNLPMQIVAGILGVHGILVSAQKFFK